MDYSFIRKREMPTTWEQLLLAADSDFVSFILLSHCGICESTSLWMAPHSIEKYLKSWLLKHDESINIKSFSHRLYDLWEKSKEQFVEDTIFKVDAYELLVKELNMDNKNIETRYSYGFEIKDPIFTKTYTSLACILRARILGDDDFKERGPFGLCDATFGGTSPFFENSKINTKEIVCNEIDRLLQ